MKKTNIIINIYIEFLKIKIQFSFLVWFFYCWWFFLTLTIEKGQCYIGYQALPVYNPEAIWFASFFSGCSNDQWIWSNTAILFDILSIVFFIIFGFWSGWCWHCGTFPLSNSLLQIGNNHNDHHYPLLILMMIIIIIIIWINEFLHRKLN